MEPRSQGYLVRAGTFVVLSAGNRDCGGRDIPTGEEQREREGEILQLFPPLALPSCTSVSHWLSLPRSLRAREPGKCSSLRYKAVRSGRGLS